MHAYLLHRHTHKCRNAHIDMTVLQQSDCDWHRWAQRGVIPPLLSYYNCTASHKYLHSLRHLSSFDASSDLFGKHIKVYALHFSLILFCLFFFFLQQTRHRKQLWIAMWHTSPYWNSQILLAAKFSGWPPGQMKIFNPNPNSEFIFRGKNATLCSLFSFN